MCMCDDLGALRMALRVSLSKCVAHRRAVLLLTVNCDLPQSLVLKSLVYDPIVEGRLIADSIRPKHPPGSHWRRQLATAVTFVWSGVEHEIYLWYIQHRFDGRWLLFFSVQVPLVLLETWLKRAAAALNAPRAPDWMGTLATLALLEITAAKWFFPVLSDPSLKARCVRSIVNNLEMVGVHV